MAAGAPAADSSLLTSLHPAIELIGQADCDEDHRDGATKLIGGGNICIQR